MEILYREEESILPLNYNTIHKIDIIYSVLTRNGLMRISLKYFSPHVCTHISSFKIELLNFRFSLSLTKRSFSRRTSGEGYGGKSNRLKQVWALQLSIGVWLQNVLHSFWYLLISVSVTGVQGVQLHPSVFWRRPLLHPSIFRASFN